MKFCTRTISNLVFSLCLLFLGITTTSAQNGQYDVRFAIKNFDCATNKVTVVLQVKAHDAAHTFLMGDANYRFDYDPRVIKNPAIISQENFSNQPPSSDLNYIAQNLNGSSVGSTLGTVSLNTIYGSGGLGAKLVPATWTNVSCIRFDVQDATKCMELIWHDDQRFPITGMSEVVLSGLNDGNYDVNIVPAGGVFQNYSVCIPTVCSGITAIDDINVTNKNVPVSGTAATNDVSLGGAMTFTMLNQPAASGSIVLNPNGTYTYTPATNFVGEHKATYQVCNVSGVCDTATITVSILDLPVAGVNNAPIAQNDNAQTAVNTPVTGNVLTNDLDQNGNTLTVTTTPTTAPTKGTVVLNPDGTFVYTPVNGFAGQDTFRYQVCDNGSPSLCDTAMVVLTITVDNNGTANDKPNAQDDSKTTLVGTPITIPVKANDTDPNGNTLGAPSVITTPTNGTVVVNADGTVTYTPNTNYVGPDKFTYSVCDNGAPVLCDTATVYVAVTPVPNYPPVITKTPITTPEDSTKTICIAVTDQNVGQTLTPSLCSGYPKNGTAGVPTIVNGSVCFTYTPTANYNGVDTLCLIVCDNGTPSICDTAKIPVTVTPVADKPIVTKTPVTTIEDTPITVCQTISDPDAGSTFTASLCSAPGRGVAGTPIVTGNQVCVQYAPAANYAGTDTVCIIVCDATGLCDTAKVPVTVTPVNDPPVITGSPVTTTDKTPITVCLPIVDPDAGDTFTPSLCGTPATGTTSTPVITNGQICVQYLPTAGASLGTQTICVQVCDAAGVCDTAHITIKVTPSNQAPVASNDINNTSKNTPTSGNVLVNDMDPDSNPLTTTVTDPANHGNFVLNPNGTYVYTPTTGFVGTDSISYKVCDNGVPSLCDTALVIIEVRDANTGSNQSPVASDDNTSTPAGRPIIVAVTSNDFDPDNGQTITAPTLLGTPVGGTPSVNPDGTVTFLPTPGFLGDASFQYKVCDNGTPVLCDTATVIVRVYKDPTVINVEPIAVNDANTTTGTTPVSGSVATNDTDPNVGQLLTFAGLTNPTKGTVTVNPNGTYTYTANPATSGLDSFKYKVCDNGIPSLCDTATVTIFVNPVVTPPTNTAPVATPDNPVTTTGVPVTINVKGNDFDPNGSPIGNPTITTPPTCGTTAVNADGTITFTPNAGFTGSCTFIYQVCDNGSPIMCDTALVTVKVDPTPFVNLPPVAINDGFVATTGVTLSGKSVAANDSDPNVGQVLTYSMLGFPAKGIASFGSAGTFTYFPLASFTTGIDSFKYRVCDNGSPILCDTATVFVEYTTAPVGNVSPIALDDNAGTTTGTKVNIPVKTNDGDPNGVGTLGNPTVPVQPACGTATVLANGTIDFTSNAGFVGDCTFKYVICDNGTPSLCDTASVTVTVAAPPAPANRAPIAQNDATTTPVNVPVNGTVASNDTDLDAGQTLTFAKLTNPFNGSVVVNTDGTYTYTPNAGFVGRDSFTYRVCDNGTPVMCATATAVIVVTPAGVNQNDKPIAGDDQVTTTPNTPIVINVKSNDIDPDGASNTLGNPVIIGTPVGGTPSVNPDGTVTFTPTPGFTGPATFTYKICDNGSPVLCDTAVVTIDVKVAPVNNVNLAPVAIDDAKTGIKNQNILGLVSTNDSDPNVGQVLTYTLVSPASSGLANLNPTTGAFTYSPVNNFIGSDYFVYSVCDNGSPVMCDTAVAYLTVLDNPCVTIQLKALIEGPYSTATGKMRTALNQRGLLPGQTPIGQFAVKTERGHPYKGAPWNYTGTEGDTITSYPATVVDWVLISLRTAAGTIVPTWRCAAWLHEDGSITIPGKPCVQLPTGNYFIVIEHRNHLGVMSPAPVTVANNALNFDFTTGDGFVLTNPPSFGAKAMSNGKWVMYAGDGKKDTQNTNFDINFNDSQLWKLQSGIFDQYRYGDFNLDADVNFSDQVLWKANNGRYSGVAH